MSAKLQSEHFHSPPDTFLEHPFIVGGSEHLGVTGNIRPVYFPGDQATLVGSHHQAEALHVELIERAAEQGFQAFRKTRPSERVRILERLTELLEQHRKRLAELITWESGKPIQLSEQEMERAIRLCRDYAAEAARNTGILLNVDDRMAEIRHFPIGPVLAITPYNFPVNLVLHKLAPAIAAGCSITIKPAVQTPLTALTIGKLAVEAGYDAISVVPMPNEVCESLVRSETFKKFSFTGSASVGWMLRQVAGMKPVTLELGGNAALIIDDLPEGSATETAYRAAFGAFANAGQSCISVQRIFLNKALREPFMAAFVAAARAMRVGDPFRHDTEIGPMISIDAVQRARSLIKEALRAGANVVYGGNTYNVFTMNPTILDRTTPDMAVNAEEVFAPIVTVTTYQHYEDALAMANHSKYGLHAGVYTSDAKKAELAYETLDVGGVIINDIPGYRSDLLPYGGVKASGLGREGVLAGIAEYSYSKTLIRKEAQP